MLHSCVQTAAVHSVLLMLCDRGFLFCRRAVLLNLKYNETIASFANAAGVGSGDKLRPSATKAKPVGSACTCIAFRTGDIPWLT